MIPKAANRDKGIAYFMERQPQQHPTITGGHHQEYAGWDRLSGGHPLSSEELRLDGVSGASMYINKLLQKEAQLKSEVGGLKAGATNDSAAANVNTRNPQFMRPFLQVVE